MAITSTLPPRTLKSNWGVISPHLLATMYPVSKEGKRLPDSNAVVALVIDGSTDFAFTWTSPFEESGAIFSTAQHLLQSGTVTKQVAGVDAKLGTSIAPIMKKAEGRTSVTRLTSTQVFTGMSPIKFNVTLAFRAWDDPFSEVHEPIEQLIKWGLPISLAKDGSVLSRLVDEVGENGIKAETLLDTFMPSFAPPMIAFGYRGKVFAPAVIESISTSMVDPVGEGGIEVKKTITLTIATLSAVDLEMWEGYGGKSAQSQPQFKRISRLK